MLALLLAAPPTPGTVEDRLGICVHLNESPPAEYPLVRAAGFGAVRTDLPWGEIERTPGKYDFARYDATVAAMRRQGLRICFGVFGINPAYGDGPPASAPARAAFARFAGAAAARWKGMGIEYEIWNEPNHRGFWKPAPNAPDYVALVKASAKAIHAADPKARVLGGSATEPLWSFLGECFRLGMLDAVDAVSLHPYRPQRPESLLADVGRLRTMMGARKKGIVFTEMGYPMSYPGQDQNRRARYIQRAFLTSLVAGVDRVYLYQWKEKVSPGESQWGFGINDERLRPLPAGAGLKALVASLRGMRYVKRLPTAAARDFVLLFEGGGRRKTVGWTGAFDPSTVPEVARDPGPRAPSVAPRATVDGKTVALSGAPQVAAAP